MVLTCRCPTLGSELVGCARQGSYGLSWHCLILGLLEFWRVLMASGMDPVELQPECISTITWPLSSARFYGGGIYTLQYVK